MTANEKIVSESGSIAPLAVGLVILTLAAVLSASSATSFFVLDRRLTALAESAALAELENGLSPKEFIIEGEPRGFNSLSVLKDERLDDLTVEVVICSNWTPPLPSVFLFLGRQICSHGAARAG
jgi:hypothetical protein